MNQTTSSNAAMLDFVTETEALNRRKEQKRAEYRAEYRQLVDAHRRKEEEEEEEAVRT